MSIPQLSETTIRRQATAQSFERGKAYFQSGAVGHLQQRGNTLQAEVEGSEVEPYTVCLTFDKGGLTSADCSCAYSFEGWCKHIVATALVCVHQPESIEERPPWNPCWNASISRKPAIWSRNWWPNSPA